MRKKKPSAKKKVKNKNIQFQSNVKTEPVSSTQSIEFYAVIFVLDLYVRIPDLVHFCPASHPLFSPFPSVRVFFRPSASKKTLSQACFSRAIGLALITGYHSATGIVRSFPHHAGTKKLSSESEPSNFAELSQLFSTLFL